MKTILQNMNPMVVVLDDVFDADTAARIIEMGRDKIVRAKVISKEGEKVSDNRTNSSSPLNQWENPLLTTLTTRLSTIMRIPPENSEEARLLHYVGAQEFKPHCDSFGDDAAGRNHLQKGGQRLFTSICYLNDVREGGATNFPKLKISVTPKCGRVLIFCNIRLGTAAPHHHSEHAGTPVTKGEKWALTHWWRAGPYVTPREFPPTEGAYVVV